MTREELEQQNKTLRDALKSITKSHEALERELELHRDFISGTANNMLKMLKAPTSTTKVRKSLA